MMKMKLIFLGAVALALSSVAFAADEVTYSMTLSTIITYQGQPAWEGEHKYHNMTLQAVRHVRARAAGVFSMLSKMKDRGGPYAATIQESTVGSDGAKTGQPLSYPGLTLSDYIAVMEAQQKVGNSLIGDVKRQIAQSKNVRSRSALGSSDDPANKLPWGK